MIFFIQHRSLRLPVELRKNFDVHHGIRERESYGGFAGRSALYAYLSIRRVNHELFDDMNLSLYHLSTQFFFFFSLFPYHLCLAIIDKEIRPPGVSLCVSLGKNSTGRINRAVGIVYAGVERIDRRTNDSAAGLRRESEKLRSRGHRGREKVDVFICILFIYWLIDLFIHLLVYSNENNPITKDLTH